MASTPAGAPVPPMPMSSTARRRSLAPTGPQGVATGGALRRFIRRTRNPWIGMNETARPGGAEGCSTGAADPSSARSLSSTRAIPSPLPGLRETIHVSHGLSPVATPRVPSGDKTHPSALRRQDATSPPVAECGSRPPSRFGGACGGIVSRPRMGPQGVATGGALRRFIRRPRNPWIRRYRIARPGGAEGSFTRAMDQGAAERGSGGLGGA